MRVTTGNLWDFLDRPESKAIVIPTNGAVTKDGRAVMGRGVAEQAKRRFPGIDRRLGMQIRDLGLAVYMIEQSAGVPHNTRLIAFPVKYRWQEKADLTLMAHSFNQLRNLSTGALFHVTFFLPMVGCGNGGRDWDTEIKPLAVQYLHADCFIVVERE
jgi:hypothetical protein